MKSTNQIIGGCIGIIVVVSTIGYLISHYPWLVIGVLVMCVAIAVAVAQPKKCQVCGNPLKRNSYKWDIKGQQKVLCPHCNQQMERKNSRDAMKELEK